MRELIVGLVDVFAEAPLTGNPLAVVEGGAGLSDQVLRNIAREFNQAETTFLFPGGRGDWRLRSFTAAGSEVFGAGHNALGAWLWLGYEGRLGRLNEPRSFSQEIGADVLPIRLEMQGNRLYGTMTQAGLRLATPIPDYGPLAAALGLQVGDLEQEPSARAASTGAPHLMIRARDPAVVDLAEPDAIALLSVLADAAAEGCYLYALDDVPAASAYARFFNPTVGLWEDSATGTAAGPLCAYLGMQGLLRGRELEVEQGTRMGRRSVLRVRLTPNAELSGTGCVVIRGKLTIDE